MNHITGRVRRGVRMTVCEDTRYVVSFQSFFVFLAVYCPFTLAFTCQALLFSVFSFIQFISLVLISKYFADRSPSYSEHSQDGEIVCCHCPRPIVLPSASFIATFDSRAICPMLPSRSLSK